MRDFVAKRTKTIKPSGIRKFFDLATEKKDTISLGVGEPDFVTPWEIRDSGISAIKKGYTQYTSNSGLPKLRENISKYLKDRFEVDFAPSDMVITVGASEAIDITLRATIDEGDEVLVPDPSYVSYKPCIELLGGVPVSIGCDKESGFKLTPENLERAITPKTKVLIFPYPNNPTGGIMEKEDIEKIIPIILKHDLLVVSDEIYAELTYGKKHCSIASFEELKGRVVLISGFSKAFAMTGWRIGYVCAPEQIKNALLIIHQYTVICAPIFSQYAVSEGLVAEAKNGYSTVEEMRDEYDRRRRFLLKEFTSMGLDVVEPLGAFYIFVSVESTGLDGGEFAKRLLDEQNVAVVPGDAFGDYGKNFIRCSYATSMKNLVTATKKSASSWLILKNKS